MTSHLDKKLKQTKWERTKIGLKFVAHIITPSIS